MIPAIFPETQVTEPSALRAVPFGAVWGGGTTKTKINLLISKKSCNFAAEFGMCIFCTLQENDELWQMKWYHATPMKKA
jgi:hypothetical protein